MVAVNLAASARATRVGDYAPVIEAIALAAFFIGLALYQLPGTRITLGHIAIPYFVFVVPVLLAFALRRPLDAWRSLRIPASIVGVMLLATLFAGAVHPHQDWAEAIKRLSYLAMGLIVLLLTDERKPLFRLSISAFVVTSAFMEAVGLYLLAHGYLEAAPLHYFGLHYTPSTRNGDAFFFLIPAFAALGIALSSDFALVVRIAFGFVCVFIFQGLLLSLSRGTWFAAACGLIACLLLAKTREAVLGAIAVAIVGTAVVVIPGQGHFFGDVVARRAQSVLQVNPQAGNSNSERLRLIGAGFGVIAANPAAGVGVEGLGHIKFSRTRPVIGTLETVYMDATAEYGVLGIVLVIFLVAWPARRLWLNNRRPDRSFLRTALIAGLIAFALNGLTVSPISSAWFWIMPMFIAAA